MGKKGRKHRYQQEHDGWTTVRKNAKASSYGVHIGNSQAGSGPVHSRGGEGARWLCNSCSYSNFSSRYDCKRCGISKSFADKLPSKPPPPPQKEPPPDAIKIQGGQGKGKGKRPTAAVMPLRSGAGGHGATLAEDDALSANLMAKAKIQSLGEQLQRVEACIQGADPDFALVLAEHKQRLEDRRAALKVDVRDGKPAVQRRQELSRQLKEVEEKLEANRVRLEAVEAEALKLRGFVETQNSRAEKIKAELAEVNMRELAMFTHVRPNDGQADVAKLEQQLVELQAQLAQARLSREASGTVVPGNVTSVPPVAHPAPFGAPVFTSVPATFAAAASAAPSAATSAAEMRRTRSASPGRGRPLATQRRLFG